MFSAPPSGRIATVSCRFLGVNPRVAARFCGACPNGVYRLRSPRGPCGPFGSRCGLLRQKRHYAVCGNRGSTGRSRDGNDARGPGPIPSRGTFDIDRRKCWHPLGAGNRAVTGRASSTHRALRASSSPGGDCQGPGGPLLPSRYMGLGASTCVDSVALLPSKHRLPGGPLPSCDVWAAPAPG